MDIRIALVTLTVAMVGCAAVPGEDDGASVQESTIGSSAGNNAPITVYRPSGWVTYRPGEQQTEKETNIRAYLPRLGGNPESVAASSPKELQQLNLVATNLVAALVQLPELNPVSVTLQVSSPTSAFGNIVVRALEEAGYGLQRVADDAGQNYVSYRKRSAETDAGPVNDYEIAIGRISVEREFIVNDNGIYPSSLMSVSGTREATDITLADDIFREQGGKDVFISGVSSPGSDSSSSPKITEVSVNDYDKTPVDRRTAQRQVFDEARRRNSLEDLGKADVDLDEYDRLRRAVLIFDDNQTRHMGTGNKQAVRLLVREYDVTDVFEITACTDADGSNDAALARGIRVEEEFIGHGVAPEALLLAPCRRADFRHPNDDSPSPVEIVHHRLKTNL